MKIYRQIIIVAFVLFIIFIFRGNLISAYNNNYLNIKSSIEEISKIKDHIFSNTTNVKNYFSVSSDVKEKEDIEPISTINVSGPLKAINNLISAGGSSKLSRENIVVLTNQERENNGGLNKLKENSKLNFSAEKKLQDMFTKQYFEHVSPSGVGVGDLGDQVSYEYIVIGENLALGNFKDDSALVDAWMASLGHRANILNKRYTEIGVAVSKGKFEGKDVWIAVQHFGLPRSSCPTINEILKGMISLDQEKVKSTGDELSSLRSKIEKGSIFEGKTISEQIDEYNLGISDYNKLISDIKKKINEYNDQVNAFNSCISNNL